MNYYYAGGIVAVLLVLFAGYKNVFGNRFKRMSVDFMTKAQYSRLGRNALADSIANFRKGTMDEKMVLVIANLIEKVPGLSTLYTIFPKKTVVNFLYAKTQSMFDLCESALKGYKKYPIPGSEITAELQLKELDSTQLDKIQEATDEFRKVLPTIEKLNPLLDELPKIIELGKIFTAKPEETKKSSPDIALVNNTDNMVVTPSEDPNSMKIVTKVEDGVMKHTLDLRSETEEDEDDEDDMPNINDVKMTVAP